MFPFLFFDIVNALKFSSALEKIYKKKLQIELQILLNYLKQKEIILVY